MTTPTKPTRAEIEAYADARLREQGHVPPQPGSLSFDTKKDVYDQRRERAIRNAELHLEHIHTLDMARAAATAEREQAELDAAIDHLRLNYLAQPGATEAEFKEVLPDLLREQRKQAALSSDTDFRRQIATARASRRYSL